MLSAQRDKWREQYSKYPALVTFGTMSVIALVILAVTTIVTQGWLLYYTFDFNPKSYLFGDHFDSISASVDSPYAKWHVIYPPLITTVYACLGWLTSPFEDGSGASHAQILANSNLPVGVFILFMILGVILLHKLIQRILCDRYPLSLVENLFVVLLLSIPFLYTIQRGNCIFYVMDCILLFLLGYRSDKKCVRYIAYAAIVIAVNIKLYPALLSLLILREGRVKEFLICVISAIAVFLVPFAFYDGGPMMYFDHLFDYSSPTESTGSLIGMRQWIAGVGQILIGNSLNSVGFVVCLAFLLVSFVLIFTDREMPFWHILAIIGCNMTIGIGVSTIYGFLYLLPALIFMLAQYDNWDVETRNATVLLALVFMVFPPVPVFKSVCTFILLIMLLRSSLRRIREKSIDSDGFNESILPD